MSKSALEKITDLFKPEAPFWACEFTTKHVIVAGVNRKRNRVDGRFAIDVPAGIVAGSLDSANILNSDGLRPVVREALNRAGFQGSEIGVVIPDDSTRIAFLSADNLPKDPAEQVTFIRWKLKKTVPFDVDTAQIAHRVAGPHTGNGAGGKGVDLLVALSPRSIVQEYENLMDALGIHAGFVVPSTLAALNLYATPAKDALFVKIAPDCVTTSVFQGKRMKFYRRVTEMSLYDAVFPTVLYYQDKLGGSAIQHLTICDSDERSNTAELEEKLQLQVHRLEPKSIDDIYKPALGTVHAAWQSLI